MRFRSIQSILPLLKLTSGKPDIDQLVPEMAEMVGIVERNLGLSRKALHHRYAQNIEVVRSQAILPKDYFEDGEILDLYFVPPNCDFCTCGCVTCRCGFNLNQCGEGEFNFGDTTLDCPFTTGTVSFGYWGLHTDADGLPMVLEGHVEAFMAYVNQIIKMGEMNAGIISPKLWQINNEIWGNQSVVTRGRDNVPTKQSIRLGAMVTSSPFKFIKP